MLIDYLLLLSIVKRNIFKFFNENELGPFHFDYPALIQHTKSQWHIYEYLKTDNYGSTQIKTLHNIGYSKTYWVIEFYD